MISPAAAQAFLRRRLDDHSWMKRLSEDKVDAAINRLNPRPDIGEFKLHQKVGFLLGLSYPQFFFIYDMGTGKTVLDLKLQEYLFRVGKLRNWSVVVVPTEESVLGWEDEIRLWTPKLPYRLLLGSSERKWRELEKIERGLVVVTYAGYSSMVSKILPVRNRKTGVVKNKRVVQSQLTGQFASYTSALTLDECTFAGNVENIYYESLRPLSFACDVRYGLAGRPFGRDPIMLWSQLFLLDHGASLSDSLGMFREAFFDKKKMYWGGPNSYDYKLNKKREPDLARALAHRSLSYELSECADLPERVPVVIKVSFSEEIEVYYKRVTAALIAARGNFKEVENAFIKLRQIASGFLGFVDDDTGERAQLEFKQNPKIAELLSKLEQMPPGRKALVFHEYTWTGSKICRELAKKGWKHGWLWGGSTDWPQTKERFENDPEFKVLVISHKKGAFSLNLQAANYLFVIESPVDPIAREQLERRVYRQGQKQTVFQYDIVVKGSVDEKILKFHREGQKLFDALVADPEKFLVL